MSYSKYGNKKTLYNGYVYDSKAEANYASMLDLRLRGKDILSWEKQVKFPIVINGNKVCTYICDFVITNKDKSQEFIDVKGVRTGVFILKKKLVEAVYGIKITEVYNK